MGFSKKVVSRIKNEYAEKYREAQATADRRRDELHAKIAGIDVIDRELTRVGIRIFEATMSGKNVSEKIDDIKKDSELLLEKRAEILRAYGYPADYSDIHYECEKCADSGYVDTEMCDCMKRALVLASYEESGLAGLIGEQSFDNFSLSYYEENPTSFKNFKTAYDKIRDFAENFSADTYRNFLFFGGTGLGKTHLSSAVAKAVIDRCFDVLYVSASGMVADFEFKRFGNSAIEGDVGDTSRYYSADLLIIDDLGTEVSNQFSIACIHDVINSRIISKKSTIISTNLHKEDIGKRYWERITSRLYGEYLLVPFTGKDIRRQKINKY